MSKITRLEQLKNENSIYRVSGVFDKSVVCNITKLNTVKHDFDFDSILEYNGDYLFQIIPKDELESKLSTGAIKIMCLERGDVD